MSRPLREITKAMAAYAEHGDTEIAHYEADALLIEAVVRLAAYATDTVDEGETEALLAAYHSVPKWFA